MASKEVTKLSELVDDVRISLPQMGQALIFNGVAWLNTTLAPYYTVEEMNTLLLGKAAASHSHAQNSITGLVNTLADKAALNHTHSFVNISGLELALSGKADSGHGHTIANITGLQNALNGKAASSHNHDSVYYTKTAIDSAIAALAGKMSTATIDAMATLAAQKTYFARPANNSINLTLASNAQDGQIIIVKKTIDNLWPVNIADSVFGDIANLVYVGEWALCQYDGNAGKWAVVFQNSFTPTTISLSQKMLNAVTSTIESAVIDVSEYDQLAFDRTHSITAGGGYTLQLKTSSDLVGWALVQEWVLNTAGTATVHIPITATGPYKYIKFVIPALTTSTVTVTLGGLKYVIG